MVGQAAIDCVDLDNARLAIVRTSRGFELRLWDPGKPWRGAGASDCTSADLTGKQLLQVVQHLLQLYLEAPPANERLQGSPSVTES